MLENWRPDTPFRSLIKDHHYTNRAEKQKGRVFNDKGQVKEQTNITLRNPRRHPHEIEGILEVQRLLLLKLAGQENRANGLFKNYTNGREISFESASGLGKRSSKADIEQFMADTAQAIRATRSKGSKIGKLCAGQH
ncbi:hypothetical protein GQ44DRAFT_734439 [Phaeosphaeriaceae sp. PMI808]|nr:hypothetical protein GQ44DRAFT_734439 [Phaeosphaeriaceae sp. PMI808]